MSTKMQIKGLPHRDKILVITGYGALSSTPNKIGGLLVECKLEEIRSENHDPCENSSYIRGSHYFCRIPAEEIQYLPVGTAIYLQAKCPLKTSFRTGKLTFQASELKAKGQKHHAEPQKNQFTAQTYRELTRKNRTYYIPSWSIFRSLYGSSTTLINNLLTPPVSSTPPPASLPSILAHLFPNTLEIDHEEHSRTLTVSRDMPESSIDDCIDLAFNHLAHSQWRNCYRRILIGLARFNTGQMSIDFPWEGKIEMSYTYRAKPSGDHEILNIDFLDFSYDSNTYTTRCHRHGDEGAFPKTSNKKKENKTGFMKSDQFSDEIDLLKDGDPSKGIFPNRISTEQTSKAPHKTRKTILEKPPLTKKSSQKKQIKVGSKRTSKKASTSKPQPSGQSSGATPLVFQGKTANLLDHYMEALKGHVSSLDVKVFALPYLIKGTRHNFARPKQEQRHAKSYIFKFEAGTYAIIDIEKKDAQSFNMLLIEMPPHHELKQWNELIEGKILRYGTSSRCVWKNSEALDTLGLSWKTVSHRKNEEDYHIVKDEILKALRAMH